MSEADRKEMTLFQWRKDGFGNPEYALFLGDLYVGSIMRLSHNGKWRAWFMDGDEGNEVDQYDQPDDARRAVENALIEALPMPVDRMVEEERLRVQDDRPESYTTDLEAEVRTHFNEPVLTHKLGRVIGYSEDECDCYIVIRYIGGDVRHHTMVGGYYWLNRLKGQRHVKSNSGEDWDDLFRLDRFLALNGSPKEPQFLLYPRCISESSDEK